MLKFFDRRFGKDGEGDGDGAEEDEEGAKNVIAYEGGEE